MNYNTGKPLKMETISQNELENALDDFSEGSPILKECLKILWTNNLATIACCKGDHLKFEASHVRLKDMAYIAFDNNIDAFSYLSLELLNSKEIEIINDGCHQVIYFYGSNKEELMKKFTSDILSGKKDNQQAIQEKINKEVDTKIYILSKIELLKSHNVDDKTIKEFIKYFTKAYEIELKLDYLLKEKVHQYAKELDINYDDIDDKHPELKEKISKLINQDEEFNGMIQELNQTINKYKNILIEWHQKQNLKK